MQPKAVIVDYIVFQDGEARINGKEHLKAELVARMHVDGGRDITYVMAHYGLTRAQVHAALAYYYENQPQLDNANEQTWSHSQAVKSADLEAQITARMTGQQ